MGSIAWGRKLRKKDGMVKSRQLTALLLAGLTLAACSNLTPTQEKTLVGGATGAAAGTVGTVILGGCIPCGTAIGGAVGAGTSYAIEKLSE